MKVRGTQPVQPKEIDVNVDTVYVRTNIQRIETPEFIGWEYDEIQYDKNEFIENSTNHIEQLKKENDLLLQSLIDFKMQYMNVPCQNHQDYPVVIEQIIAKEVANNG